MGTSSSLLRKVLVFALKAVIFLAIVTLIIRAIDLGELRALLPTLSVFFFCLTFLAVVADITIVGMKWWVLLGAFQIRVPLRVPVIAYYTGRIFTLVAPSSLGIDAYKAHFLRKEGLPLIPVISSIFVERFVGMLSSLAIVSLLLPFAAEPLGLHPRSAWMAGGWAVFVLLWVGLVYALSRSHVLANEVWTRRLPGVVRGKFQAFLIGISGLHENRGRVLYYFAISTVEKLFYGTVVYFSARTIGFELGYFELLSLTPIVSMLERLPISISSFGVREGLFVGLLNLFGADATQAVAIALVMRVAEVGMLLFSLSMWFFVGGRGVSREEIRSVQERLFSLRWGGGTAGAGSNSPNGVVDPTGEPDDSPDADAEIQQTARE